MKIENFNLVHIASISKEQWLAECKETNCPGGANISDADALMAWEAANPAPAKKEAKAPVANTDSKA